MGDKNNEQSIMDKSIRSVFVGNIPYEATEDKLKEIFNEVGPVLSLKLVFDRESGKPKGYGFCEYKDQETAMSAMRNLNGYEIGGRTLRVDNACTEKSRMEMQQLLQGPQVDNPYGAICTSEQAPEHITKTVAALPPEQMFELMKQMKTCIQNNPSEARQMLLQNPQLSYALLQALVVMRIVDPQRAVTMLHKANVMPPVLGGQSLPAGMHPDAAMAMLAMSGGVVVPPSVQQQPPVAAFGQDIDLRGGVPVRHMVVDQDMRGVLPHDGGSFSRGIPPPQQKPPVPQALPPQRFPSDPRQRPIDPRMKLQQAAAAASQQHPPPGISPSVVAAAAAAPSASPGQTGGASGAAAANAGRVQQPSAGGATGVVDHEKAALISQVLRLTEEQIAMLPLEQRTSILVLREQVAKSNMT